MPNNNLVISKSTLVPLGLVIVIVGMLISGMFFVSEIKAGIQHNLITLETHRNDINIHQTYKDKLASWYTRPEGEALEIQFWSLDERLDSIERKIDLLLASSKTLDSINP